MLTVNDPPPAGARPQRRSFVAALALAALFSASILPSVSFAQSPMIQGWLAANTACKAGPSDNPKAQKACARRDELSGRLKRRGCEYQEDGDWWRCPH